MSQNDRDGTLQFGHYLLESKVVVSSINSLYECLDENVLVTSIKHPYRFLRISQLG